jgi:hypothetical protein
MLSPQARPRPRPRPRPRWWCLVRPKWLAWHAFAVLAAAGMLWLGGWQLHRAEAGNELSWAYTFEWPLFAVLGAVFWVKTLKEELRAAPAGQDPDDAGAVTTAGTPGQSGTGPSSAGPTSAGPPSAGPPAGADPVARSPAGAAATAYAARLRAETRGHGRWHGLR